MLVLSRKKKETITIAGGIVITVLSVKGGYVRIGVEAPLELRVLRGELVEENPPEPEETSHAA